MALSVVPCLHFRKKNWQLQNSERWSSQFYWWKKNWQLQNNLYCSLCTYFAWSNATCQIFQEKSCTWVSLSTIKVVFMQLQSSLSHSQIVHLSRMRFRYKNPGCMRRVRVNINMSYALSQQCSPPAVRINYNWFFMHAYNCTWCQPFSVLKTVNLSRNINNAQCLQDTKDNCILIQINNQSRVYTYTNKIQAGWECAWVGRTCWCSPSPSSNNQE